MKKYIILICLILFQMNIVLSLPSKNKSNAKYFVCYLYTLKGDIYKTTLFGYNWSKLKSNNSNKLILNNNQIDNQEINQIKILKYFYSHNYLDIILTKKSSIKINVYNIMGKQLLSIKDKTISENHTFNLEKYVIRKGIYFISIELDDKSIKFIKIIV